MDSKIPRCLCTLWGHSCNSSRDSVQKFNWTSVKQGDKTNPDTHCIHSLKPQKGVTNRLTTVDSSAASLEIGMTYFVLYMATHLSSSSKQKCNFSLCYLGTVFWNTGMAAFIKDSCSYQPSSQKAIHSLTYGSSTMT